MPVCSSRSVAQRSNQVILHLLDTSEFTSEGLSPVGVPSKRRTWTYCSKASERTLIWSWLEHKTCEDRLRNLALFYLEKRRLSGASYCYLQPPDGRIQTWTVMQPEATDTKWNTQKSHYRLGKPFPLQGQLNTGPGCPKRLWILHFWSCSKPDWMWSWRTWANWTSFKAFIPTFICKH